MNGRAFSTPVIPEFKLERWLRAQEKLARFAIGGSGVPRGELAPFLPSDWERAWATHPDEAVRAVKDAVRAQYKLDEQQVIPAAGASEADAATILGLAGAGAHVLVEKPAYHALLQPALAFGCRVERIERASAAAQRGADGSADPSSDHTLDPELVISKVRDDTKLVILARPNNPTGDAIPADALRRIAERAARVGAHVLVDEVFADATTLGDDPACKIHERILSVNSLTKCLGYSHLRCGWVAGAPEAIEAIDRAKAVLSVNNAMLDLLIGARVLEARPRLVAQTRARRAANAEIARQWMKVGPHGTTTLLPLPAGVDDISFANELAAKRGVVTPPGSYVEMPGHVRIGLVGDPGMLRSGLEELSAALAAR